MEPCVVHNAASMSDQTHARHITHTWHRAYLLDRLGPQTLSPSPAKHVWSRGCSMAQDRCVWLGCWSGRNRHCVWHGLAGALPALHAGLRCMGLHTTRDSLSNQPGTCAVCVLADTGAGGVRHLWFNLTLLSECKVKVTSSDLVFAFFLLLLTSGLLCLLHSAVVFPHVQE